MKAFYRPHKMALWNLLVPDLVKLAEREMDVAIDKLPHSRFPSATSAGNSETNIVIDGRVISGQVFVSSNIVLTFISKYECVTHI